VCVHIRFERQSAYAHVAHNGQQTDGAIHVCVFVCMCGVGLHTYVLVSLYAVGGGRGACREFGCVCVCVLRAAGVEGAKS